MVDSTKYKLMPIIPTAEIISAMATSKARDDEGEFPLLMDLLDYSGENKTRTVLTEAYSAALNAQTSTENELHLSELNKIKDKLELELNKLQSAINNENHISKCCYDRMDGVLDAFDELKTQLSEG